MTEAAKPKKLSPRELVTPECRLSFPVLFKPRSMKQADGTDGVPKFQATLLLPPKTDFKPFIAALAAAMQEKWSKLLTLPGDKNPIKDCTAFNAARTAEDKPTYAGYDDGWSFIRLNATSQPAVVDRSNVPVTDPSKVYPGMWVRAYVQAFGWEHKMKGRGVSFGLQAIQIVRDGERLDGRRDASDVFEPLEAPADAKGAAVDLQGLFG